MCFHTTWKPNSSFNFNLVLIKIVPALQQTTLHWLTERSNRSVLQFECWRAWVWCSRPNRRVWIEDEISCVEPLALCKQTTAFCETLPLITALIAVSAAVLGLRNSPSPLQHMSQGGKKKNETKEFQGPSATLRWQNWYSSKSGYLIQEKLVGVQGHRQSFGVASIIAGCLVNLKHLASSSSQSQLSSTPPFLKTSSFQSHLE